MRRRDESTQRSDAIALLNWELYRKIRRIEMMATTRSPGKSLPRLSELEMTNLASLGFANGSSQVAIPSSDLLTSRVLEVGYASRKAYRKPVVHRPVPRYYARPNPARFGAHRCLLSVRAIEATVCPGSPPESSLN
jgi:hypothetical protein